MLPVARKNVANAKGSGNENCSRRVNVTGKPSTSTVNTELGLRPEGFHRIPPPVTSRGPFRHTRLEDSSQGKGPFPLTTLEAPSRVPGQFPLTMEAASFQANVPYPHTTEAASFQASVPYLHTMEVGSSPDRELSPHTMEVERFPISVLFRLTTGVGLCPAPSLFLRIALWVPYQAPPSLSPLIWAVAISQELLLPRTIPTPTTIPPTVKWRGKWVI